MTATPLVGQEWLVVGSRGKPRRPKTPNNSSTAAGEPSTAGSAQQSTPPPVQYPLCPAYPSSFDAPVRDWRAESPPTQPYKRPSKGPQTDAMRLAAQLHILQLNRFDVQSAPVCAELQRAMSLAAERLQSVAQLQIEQQSEDAQQEAGPPTSTASTPDHWAHVPDMVVYGLGSIEQSRNARFQLALATLLQQLLPGLVRAPQVFDPVFSELDKRVLVQLGMELIEHDESGGRAVSRPTVFYLPHCEAPLCDNLLAANWSQEQLPLVVILGNSFQSYHERWSAPGARGNRPERLLQLVEFGVVLELPVRDHGFHVASAFNDMSLHVFPAALVQQHASALFN